MYIVSMYPTSDVVITLFIPITTVGWRFRRSNQAECGGVAMRGSYPFNYEKVCAQTIELAVVRSRATRKTASISSDPFGAEICLRPLVPHPSFQPSLKLAFQVNDFKKHLSWRRDKTLNSINLQ